MPRPIGVELDQRFKELDERLDALEAASVNAANERTSIIEDVTGLLDRVAALEGVEPEPEPEPDPEPTPEPEPDPEPEPEPTPDPEPDGPTVWFTEDYTRYADTATFRASALIQPDSQGVEHMHLTSDKRYEARYPAGDGCGSIDISRRQRFPANVYDLWWELDVQFSDGFTTHRPECNVLAGDLNDWKGVAVGVPYPNYRWSFHIGHGAKERKNFAVEVPGTANGYLRQQVDITHTGSPNDLLWDGQRHIIRGRFRTPSDHETQDGLYLVMVDDFTVSNFLFQTAWRDEANRPQLDKPRIPMKGYGLWDIMNDGAPQEMSVFTASPKFYNADPGWGW